MTSALFRRRSLIAKLRSRFYRPLVESLESRDLLAFNLKISLADTANVGSVTTLTTTTFTAAGNGANLNVADIDNALRSGNNVVVTSGTEGTEAGNITTSGFTSRLFNNDPGTTLLISTGSGEHFVGNIGLSGLQLRDTGTLIIQADSHVKLEDVFIAKSMTISATGGSISMSEGGRLQASELTLTAQDGIGTAGQPLPTSVDSLTTNTTSGNGDQFINEASFNGLSAFNLNAGTGDVTLNVQVGAVTDADAAIDVTANIATIVLFDETVKDFGSAVHAIGTSVNSLSVSTEFGSGNQFITELNGLTALNLVSSLSGDVTLHVTAGSVLDTDASLDIDAQSATITFSDTTFKTFGAAFNPIHTSVDVLSVNTAVGSGDLRIVEANGLTALNLSGGTEGIVSLEVTAGAVADSDTAADIAAAIGFVVLRDVTPKNFGAAGAPINTSVNSLTVSTNDGRGSQFIAEANRLINVDLSAGTGVTRGDVTLTVAAGAVLGGADGNFVRARKLSVLLNDTIPQDFGTFSRPIETDVDELSVNTAAGGGDQFISEADSTTVTNLNAGTGSITLAGGMFNLAIGDALGDNSTLVVNSPAIVNLASVSETVGGLAGSGTVAFLADGVNTFLTVGGNNQDTIFSGSLTGNDVPSASPQDRLVKQGSGTLTFSGNHTFTGEYDASAGKLLVTGSLAASFASAVAVGEGTIGGTGTINRSVVISFDGHLAPGTSTGVLRTGRLNFTADSSTFDVEITSGTAGQFDQIIVTGTVMIATGGNGVALNITKLGTANLQNGDQLVLIDNDGITDAVTGTFKDLPEGANLGSNFLGSGLTGKISYVGGSGNDVVLTMSPGSLFPWHNEAKPLDVAGGQTVDPDGAIVAGDALQVINYLNGLGAGAVPENAVLGLPHGFLDVDGDNFVTAGDVLEVINFLNAGFGGEGEGEAPQGFPGFRVQSSEEGNRSQEISAEFGVRSAEWGGGPGRVVDSDGLMELLAADVAGVVGRKRR